MREKLFGNCVTRVGVIEFQKRGAPHSHLLIWIKDFQPSPENINNIICTELPNEGDPGTKEQEFRELVLEK